MVPKPEHYSCVVDLLGRSGFIDQTYQFMNEIPVEFHTNAWETLPSACRFHGNLELENSQQKGFCMLNLHMEQCILFCQTFTLQKEGGRMQQVLEH